MSKQPNKTKLAVIYWAVIFAIAIVGAILFESCSLLKKSKSVSNTTIDSTSVVNKIEMVSEKKDSVVVIEDKKEVAVTKEEEYEKETVIEDFAIPKPQKKDTATSQNKNLGDDYVYSWPHGDSDYFPILRRTTIREKGKKKEQFDFIEDHSRLDKVSGNDNSTKISNENVSVQKAEKVKEKKVRRTSIAWWVWLLIIAAIIFIIYKKKNKILSFAKGVFTGI
jgi:hypothetical protein